MSKKWPQILWSHLALSPDATFSESWQVKPECRSVFQSLRLSFKINVKELNISKEFLHLSVRYPSWFDGDVGPRGEAAHVKHDVSPGVDAKVSGQNSDEVQYEAGFYLKEQRVTFSSENKTESSTWRFGRRGQMKSRPSVLSLGGCYFNLRWLLQLTA